MDLFNSSAIKYVDMSFDFRIIMGGYYEYDSKCC